MIIASKLVWIQAYIGSQKIGGPFRIKPVPEDIYALTEAVIKAKPNGLKEYDASDLLVYGPGSKAPFLNVEALAPDRALSFPTSATTKNDEPGPLIVVALPQQQKEVSWDLWIVSFDSHCHFRFSWHLWGPERPAGRLAPSKRRIRSFVYSPLRWICRWRFWTLCSKTRGSRTTNHWWSGSLQVCAH